VSSHIEEDMSWVSGPSYILSAFPLILSYRRKNVVRIEGIGYTSEVMKVSYQLELKKKLVLKGQW
jgi:hypothetical protein